ncbi:MAG: hypothetical protein R2745_26405 [Vicinamibacterales bacterium]
MNFSGADSFVYQLSTSGGTSAPATVSITVSAPTGSQAPTAFRVSSMRGNLVTLSRNPPASGPALGTIPLGIAPSVSLSLPSGSFFLRLRALTPADGPAPSGYVLNVSGSFVGAVPMAARTLTVPAPPGTYTFSVVATNGCGTGASTAPRTVAIP